MAEARGQKNAGSVSNRILKLRKKYNLPIGAGGTKKAIEHAEAGDTKIPVTPSKNRVSKSRGRALPVKKGKKAIKDEDEAEDDDLEDGEDNGEEELKVEEDETDA